ncbi:hypothetical protein Q3A66_13020 [Hymenobacter sp. BT770]|uniref:hypothetical protein n=1 Tax=Hymenobacter sp. BT770 TaxID=2886942 RepID=UPI001D109CB8|nr:hypothetical protein [Hymenobacter sp. BT770]MCC3153843.1 hypothetical protein [Hymenobacter sp. BT770]MDO3415987.1 hypothetical protein [Hymenobacter sp. BT770]
MKIIERLLSVLGWLQIFISPAIIGAVTGAFIWLALRGSLGIVLGLSMGILGCFAGSVFAEKARRGKGTIEFMSRTIAHPELREKEKKK